MSSVRYKVELKKVSFSSNNRSWPFVLLETDIFGSRDEICIKQGKWTELGWLGQNGQRNFWYLYITASQHPPCAGQWTRKRAPWAVWAVSLGLSLDGCWRCPSCRRSRAPTASWPSPPAPCCGPSACPSGSHSWRGRTPAVHRTQIPGNANILSKI